MDVALDPSEMEGMDEQALKDKYDDYVKEQRKANSSALPDDSYEDEKKSKKKKQKVRVLADDICRLFFVFLAAVIAVVQVAAADALLSRTARKTKTSGFDIIATYARFCCGFCVNMLFLLLARTSASNRSNSCMFLVAKSSAAAEPHLPRPPTLPSQATQKAGVKGAHARCLMCRAAVQGCISRSAFINRILDFGAALTVTATATVVCNSCAAKVYRVSSVN